MIEWLVGHAVLQQHKVHPLSRLLIILSQECGMLNGNFTSSLKISTDENYDDNWT